MVASLIEGDHEPENSIKYYIDHESSQKTAKIHETSSKSQSKFKIIGKVFFQIHINKVSLILSLNLYGSRFVFGFDYSNVLLNFNSRL